MGVGSRGMSNGGRKLLLRGVSPLLQELAKPSFPFRQTCAGYESGEPDPVILRHAVQNSYGRTVSEQDPLGIHSH